MTLFAGKSLPARDYPFHYCKAWSLSICSFATGLLDNKSDDRCFWKDGVPALSVLWLGEPDLTEHETAPGAPAALAAIKSADENLAAVLSALDEREARGTTDVFIVSDHGFSTIRRSVDLRKILNEAGFTATTEFNGEPKPGDIMLAGNGGSVLFYVVGHDKTVRVASLNSCSSRISPE